MVSRMSQRTVYAVTAVIVASMIGGFALASFSFGTVSTHYQGSQTTTVVNNVPGLTYVSTSVVVVNSPESATATSCTATPNTCNVAAGAYESCAGDFAQGTAWTPCAAGDFVEQVLFNTVVAVGFPGGGGPAGSAWQYPNVNITLYVTGTPQNCPVTGPPCSPGTAQTYAAPTEVYYEQTVPAAMHWIAVDIDLGNVTTTGLSSVTSISVIADGTTG